MFEADEVSDQPESVMLAELIREQVLRRTFQEVPHAVEVVVEDIDVRRDDLIRVTALAWVEAESQKGILIGAQGKMIKAIGTAARRELERHLDSRSTSTCRSACAATGAPTTRCSIASASNSAYAARQCGARTSAPRHRPWSWHASRSTVALGGTGYAAIKLPRAASARAS